MRTFKSPSGREWTADVLELPRGVVVQDAKGDHAATAVLRFSSGEITLDLTPPPSDWEQLTDEELIKLVRLASPPSFSPHG